MTAVAVTEPGGGFEVVEREVPRPGPGEVLVKVGACGICHSDVITQAGLFPGLEYPRVPGHEVAGTVAAVGPGVQRVSLGERVGVGWHGGHCGQCDACRRGSFVTCRSGRIPGISYDGGYAEYMVAPEEALARLPPEIPDLLAAPLLCAGITTFNALRNSGARAGDLVAVLGVGGLGHLGVQFASKMGYRTVAIARGDAKRDLALQLGAHAYIDSVAEDPAAALAALGGARVILSTVTSGKAMTRVLGGLGLDGTLILLGVAEDPVEVPTLPFIMGRQSVQGWPSGSSVDSEDTLAFSALTGVRPLVEEFPLERAGDAFEHMMSGDARFRAVLTPGPLRHD